MSANFYELLKYAATGIASPDMTYYDRMQASTLMGGAVRTLTGQPPLTFKADGTPLTAWSMKGNGQQTGTPTPDNPVMPEFVGVRTGNLWSEDHTGIGGNLKYVPVFVGDGTFTMSTDTPNYSGNAPLFLLSGNVASGASTPINGVYNGVSRTVNSSNGYVTIAFRRQSELSDPTTHKTMLNLGSTALPYEPFGWAEKITCAGQTVPVYLGQTQTVRRIKKLVLTGTESLWGSGTSTVYFATAAGTDTMLQFSTVVSSHYSYHDGGTSSAPNNSVYTKAGAGTALWFKTDYGNDVDAFKAYLADEYAAGHPVTVWYVLATEQTGIVNEPLAKIGDYADELNSEDAGVSIPTVKGSNVLTVETELQPSEMTITYKG